MIRENVFKIRKCISLTCSNINREASSVIIIAVSKGRTIEEIKDALDAGITDIGENKVQEAIVKFNALGATQNARRVKWHMIGHLQTNKVKDAVRIFDLIQSVDSFRLAREIDKEAVKINKVQDILIEVKTSPETAKFGIKPEEAIDIIKEISRLKNINLKGLFTIAPLAGSLEQTRPYFRKLKELLNEINAIRDTQYAIRVLSMGMTLDFPIAIEEGANMIRLGRAIFENMDLHG